MKRTILILFTISLFHQIAFGQWITQNSGTTQHLYDVYFINTQTGWASGENGTLLKTTNGGGNWFALNSGIDNRPLNSIQFINENTGWSCTSLISIAGVIIKTTDGGNSWSTQYSNPNKSFLSLFFMDSLSGWAASSGNGGFVYRTTNGGSNWDSVSLISGGATGRDIEFVNSQTGWAAMGSKIFKTTNGGVNWVQQFSTTGAEMQSLSFLNSNTGYSVSLELWEVYKTTDSGNNWIFLVTLPQYFNTHCIFFKNINTGYVSGDGGRMFSTTNGGINWSQQQTNTNSFLQSVQFVTDSIGWAVGGAGKIIHTDSMGQIQPVVNISSEVPQHFELFQNYPNPFNSETIFKFSIIEADIYRLEVFDLLGRKTGELINSRLNSGTYEISYNASMLSTGTYFYRLSGSENFIVKKMILIK